MSKEVRGVGVVEVTVFHGKHITAIRVKEKPSKT
jgi:hypothetical protein